MARRKDHSREEIHRMALDAAEAIAATEGYGGLSTRKVAAAIGYTVGTLYLVFRNLDDLILQVNARTLDSLYDALQAQRASMEAEEEAEEAVEPAKSLTALAHAYIAYAQDQTPRWSMLFEYVTEKNDALPDWYQHKLGKVFGLVETALRPLASGEPETQRAARVLWAGVHGICTLKVRRRMDLAVGQSAGEMAGMLIDNFLRGLRERPSAPDKATVNRNLEK